MSSPVGAQGKKSGYEVPRPAESCCVCQRAIEPGEKFFAAVRETPSTLERLDICKECWDRFDRSGLLGFWQTTLPQKGEEKKKLFVDDEVLTQLFEKLADAQELVKVQFRFVLGLILMRKRLVLFDQSKTQDGRDFWVVRLRGRDQLMDLLDPKLNEQQIAEVSTQLGQILSEEM